MRAKESTQKVHIKQRRVEAPCEHRRAYMGEEERGREWSKNAFLTLPPLLCTFSFPSLLLLMSTSSSFYVRHEMDNPSSAERLLCLVMLSRLINSQNAPRSKPETCPGCYYCASINSKVSIKINKTSHSIFSSNVCYGQKCLPGVANTSNRY